MSDIDFLLDSEKEKIQNEISNKYSKSENKFSETGENEKEEKDEPKPDPEKIDNNKKKKGDLITDFLKLQSEAGTAEYDEKKLKRMTKAEIIKLIANFMNKQFEEKASETEQKIIEGPDGKPEIIEVPKNELSPEKLQLVAEGIYAINYAMVSVLETTSIQLKDKTWGVATLEKWTEKVAGKKRELIIIFTQMYIDYKPQFDKYLSPLVQYSIIMMETGARTVLENLKKKKEQKNDN